MALNQLSIASLVIIPTCGGRELSSATGFLFRKNEQVWLVTNWHVAAGRSVYTGQPLTKQGDTPDALRITIWTNWSGGVAPETRVVPLYGGDSSPLWFQHQDGQDVDIAVIPLPVAIQEEIDDKAAINDNCTPDMALSVGSDVFLLGYPKGLMKQEGLPIWKRGSVATEPSIGIDGKRVYLVDTASRGGMSGAPVVLYSEGTYLKKDGTAFVGFQPVKRFAGVYSGRYGTDQLEAQLAKVWSEEYIDGIIDSRIVGDYELRTPPDL